MSPLSPSSAHQVDASPPAANQHTVCTTPPHASPSRFSPTSSAPSAGDRWTVVLCMGRSLGGTQCLATTRKGFDQCVAWRRASPCWRACHGSQGGRVAWMASSRVGRRQSRRPGWRRSGLRSRIDWQGNVSWRFEFRRCRRSLSEPRCLSRW